jgi:hypothetical protein
MSAATIDFSTDSPTLDDAEGIVQEIAVVDVTTLSSQQWRFMRPRGFTDVVGFCCGINSSVDGGDVSYDSFYNVLKCAADNYKMIFTSSEGKCNVIKNLLSRNTVFNLNDFACMVDIIKAPPQVGADCLYHQNKNMFVKCPHPNAYRLARWCKSNFKLINLFDTFVRDRTFKNWNNEFISKTAMSSYGFIHTPCEYFKDSCECIFCGLQVMQWDVGDHPYISNINIAIIFVQFLTTLKNLHLM